MRRLAISIGVLVFVAAACAEAEPTNDTAQGSGPVVVAAVGDIACNSLPSEHARRCRYDAVADAIRAIGPERFLALGDLQYLHGGLEDFRAYYDRFFGDLKEITSPVPGNHETYTLYSDGYFEYFGRGPARWPGGYYAFDLGSWHVLALNSQICKGSTWNPELGQNTPITSNPAVSDGCGPGSAMYEFAKKDLVLHQASCTLAFMHHPLFGSRPWPAGVFLLQLQPLWELLDQQGVDVVLAGHEHNYQRFAQMDAFGRADPNGIREFIVGTGGSTYSDLPKGEAAANREAGQDASFGVLKLTLREGAYDWEFVTAEGERPFLDAGSADCV